MSFKLGGVYRIKAFKHTREVYSEDHIAGPNDKDHVKFIMGRLQGIDADNVTLEVMDHGVIVKRYCYNRQPTYVLNHEVLVTDDFKLRDDVYYEFNYDNTFYVANNITSYSNLGVSAYEKLSEFLSGRTCNVTIKWVNGKQQDGFKTGQYCYVNDGRLVHQSGDKHDK